MSCHNILAASQMMSWYKGINRLRVLAQLSTVLRTTLLKQSVTFIGAHQRIFKSHRYERNVTSFQYEVYEVVFNTASVADASILQITTLS